MARKRLLRFVDTRVLSGASKGTPGDAKCVTEIQRGRVAKIRMNLVSEQNLPAE